MYLSLSLLKGFEKGYPRFYCERELETEQNCNILIPTLMAVSVVSFSFSRAAQPEAQGPSSLLDDGFLYCILSPTGLQNSIGGPKSPFGQVWLSLPHLVSNVSDPQLSDFLSWPSYIIVQHPLNLWNGMFDRHQVEITVMQFRGHSLLVHQSMSVSWAFTLSHFISQIHLRDFFRLLAIGMCHFLLVHHFGMACLASRRSKYNRRCYRYFLYVFTNLSTQAGFDTGSLFKQSLTSFNSEFSFSKTDCLAKTEEPSLPYHLPIAGGRIIGFIPFPRVLALYEMQSVSSRIWTRVVMSIFDDDNHYTMGTSILYDTEQCSERKSHTSRIDWFWWNVNLSGVILCLKVKELCSLNINIYISCVIVS